MSKTTTKALVSWQGFQTELAQRETEIAALLPQHVSKARFMASAIAAVKQTPGLLQAEPRSLFAALSKSAQDGLLPDGREGVITVYRVKQKDGSYLPIAQWNPMAHGLRKRARELDSIVVNAQVVYGRDTFIWHEGDEPRIEHEPAVLGDERGEPVGAYAIFRNADGVLHREVMSRDQIETVRSQSREPNGLLWGKFWTEAWRKTVIRRGFKTVPVSEQLERVITSDDGSIDLDAAPPVAQITETPDRSRDVRVVQSQNGVRELPPVVGDEAETIEPDAEPERDELDRVLEDNARAAEQEAAPEPEPAAMPSSDPDVALKAQAWEVAGRGVAAYQAFFAGLTREQRRELDLAGTHAECKAVAQDIDRAPPEQAAE